MQRNLEDYNVADTSKQCYRELRDEGEISRRHREYLLALWERGIPSTDQEVAHSVGKSDPNYFRPRRKELLDGGFLIECDKHVCSVSGRMAKTFWFSSIGLGVV